MGHNSSKASSSVSKQSTTHRTCIQTKSPSPQCSTYQRGLILPSLAKSPPTTPLSTSRLPPALQPFYRARPTSPSPSSFSRIELRQLLRDYRRHVNKGAIDCCEVPCLLNRSIEAPAIPAPSLLDADDFVRMLGRIGASEQLALSYFRVFDVNGDGFVDFSEFCAGMSILCKGSLKNKLQFLFTVFDTDNDGTLSLDEVIQAVRTSVVSAEHLLASQHISFSDLDYVTHVDDEEYILAACASAFHACSRTYVARLTLQEFDEFIQIQPELLHLLSHFDGLYCSMPTSRVLPRTITRTPQSPITLPPIVSY